MARIDVNTTGFQPHLYLSVDTTTLYDGTGSVAWVGAPVNALDVICLQDITVNNSTGIFSWVDFCSTDMNKITTPADNSISTNMVVDKDTFFGDGTTPPVTAPDYGVAGLSSNKIYVQWVLVMNGALDAATVARAGAANEGIWYRGTGFLTSIAPTVSPDSPVWVSPLEVAVTGDMTTGFVTS
tara:strand:- start:1067 stop:1615 length:549 start_codon:yes stop_codon:yes gene_type:complete